MNDRERVREIDSDVHTDMRWRHHINTRSLHVVVVSCTSQEELAPSVWTAQLYLLSALHVQRSAPGAGAVETEPAVDGIAAASPFRRFLYYKQDTLTLLDQQAPSLLALPSASSRAQHGAVISQCVEQLSRCWQHAKASQSWGIVATATKMLHSLLLHNSDMLRSLCTAQRPTSAALVSSGSSAPAAVTVEPAASQPAAADAAVQVAPSAAVLSSLLNIATSANSMLKLRKEEAVQSIADGTAFTVQGACVRSLRVCVHAKRVHFSLLDDMGRRCTRRSTVVPVAAPRCVSRHEQRLQANAACDQRPPLLVRAALAGAPANARRAS